MPASLLAGLRLAGFLLMILLFLLPILLANLLRLHALRGILLRWYYRFSGRFWGVRVATQGRVAPERPLLIVSNHCTYLDIPALGQVVDVRFTPKAEIRYWPLIGWLCLIAGCVFIERSRSKTDANRGLLRRALKERMAISLFPEGSTNDGKALLPFRSSFFSLAEESFNGEPLKVQPVCLRYAQPDGAPLSAEAMRKIAWIGEDEFVPHLWEYLKTPGTLATVTFLEPVSLAQFTDRKELARHCEEAIANYYVSQ